MAKGKNEENKIVNEPIENGDATPETTKKASEIDWEEKVPLVIPRDPANPKETDCCICHNGKIYQIMLGVEVMVPRCVKQSYLDSVAQLTKAFNNQVKASEPQGQDLK